MKVVAILGGLGSQMFKYAFYLQLKQLSGEKCYINTIPFYMQEMWNGYELKRIFSIEDEDIIDFFTESEIQNLRDDKKRYYEVSMDLMKRIWPQEKCLWVCRGKVYQEFWDDRQSKDVTWKQRIISTVESLKNRFIKKEYIDIYPKDFHLLSGNVLYDEFNHTSDQYFKSIKNKLVEVFTFPEFTDEKNEQISKLMLRTNSVALHIRRSDHLYDNVKLFKRRYFAKSVKYIKRNVTNPVFFVFSDESGWCKKNLQELGLHQEEVYFIDWNKNEESYRDMQLMTYCQHNILCISSFSWWGYFLSKRRDKIVIAPKEYWFEVPVHF